MVSFKGIVKAIVPTKAKLSNVVEVLKASVTGKGVTANTGSAKVDKVLSAAASHPFVTAAVVAAPLTSVGKTALAKVGTSVVTGSKALPGLVGSQFIKNPIATSAGLLVGVPLVAGVIASKPSIIVEAPQKAFKAGSSFAGFVSDNPVPIAIGASLGGALLAGKALSGLLPPGEDKGVTILPVDTPTGPVRAVASLPSAGSVPSSNVPLTPPTQVLGRSVSSTARKRKSPKLRQTPSQSVRVNILNQQNGRFISSSRYGASRWA